VPIAAAKQLPDDIFQAAKKFSDDYKGRRPTSTAPPGTGAGGGRHEGRARHKRKEGPAFHDAFHVGVRTFDNWLSNLADAID